jgi:hypothetical protein
MRLHLTLVLQVALVGNDHDGKVILVLDLHVSCGSCDLGRGTSNSPAGSAGGTSTPPQSCSATLSSRRAKSPRLLCELDSCLISKSYLTRPHVCLSHRTVLFLPRRVEHVQQRDLFVDDALLAVRVLCGVSWVREAAGRTTNRWWGRTCAVSCSSHGVKGVEAGRRMALRRIRRAVQMTHSSTNWTVSSGPHEAQAGNSHVIE